jgi:hypothetical protein
VWATLPEIIFFLATWISKFVYTYRHYREMIAHAPSCRRFRCRYPGTFGFAQLSRRVDKSACRRACARINISTDFAARSWGSGRAVRGSGRSCRFDCWQRAGPKSEWAGSFLDFAFNKRRHYNYVFFGHYVNACLMFSQPIAGQRSER